ncbi:MAG: cysteine--tRNA ligase [archaeon]
MALRLFNTLTRKKDVFKPITPGKVLMYTCGPTVYDFAHIGNFRAYVCADILRRYLEYSDLSVRHVMNITDVDDKTIRNSREQKISLKDYTEKYTKAFFEDLDALNIERALVYPKATEHIKEMLAIIDGLEKKGLAYKGDDGSWYYNVKDFSGYGKLSKIKMGELKAGARVKQDEYQKEEAHDFALWKAWDEADGDVQWDAPIGKGRPGWHIECSAMSSKHLGDHFDIHTGGIDLVFPHHENEIAQSEGCSGHQFVNYWVHNEWLLVDGKKMSKSLGNFFTLRDLLEKGHKAAAIRYLLLSQHYKVQLNFTEEGLNASQAAVDRLNELAGKLRDAKSEATAGEMTTLVKEASEQFQTHMDDDLQIAQALAAVFDFVKKANQLLDAENVSEADAREAIAFLERIDKVLGVIDFAEEEIPAEVTALADKRLEAKNAKDWATADRLRDEISSKGYRIDDTKDGYRIVKD